MKVLQVIGGVMKAAGTSVFCVELADALKDLGVESAIAVLNPDSRDAISSRRNVPFYRIAEITETLQKDSSWDAVHLHGMWEKDLFRISRIAHKVGVNVVWSPHGMLTPWALNFKRFRKKIALGLYLRRELARAQMLHVTAQSEVEDVRRIGLKNPVVIAPLGVKTSLTNEEIAEVKKGVLKSSQSTLLFVSRIQKKKGLINLVDAWGELKRDAPDLISDWKVKIVGPDQEGHREEVRTHAKMQGVERDFELCEPVFGRDKDLLYASADLFVLPTHSENFGSVVIESLVNKTPVITTKGAPWRDLEDCHAGAWVDVGVEPLKAALRKMMKLSKSERLVLGENGRRLVDERYSWTEVGKTMFASYRSLKEDAS